MLAQYPEADFGMVPQVLDLPPIHFIVFLDKIFGSSKYIGPDKDHAELILRRHSTFGNKFLEDLRTQQVQWEYKSKVFSSTLVFESPLYNLTVTLKNGSLFSGKVFTFVYNCRTYHWKSAAIFKHNYSCVTADSGKQVAAISKKAFSKTRASVDLFPDSHWTPGFKEFLEGTFALPHSGKGELPRSSVFNESSPSFVAPKEGLNSLSLSSMTASHSFQSASAGLAFSNDSFSIHRSTTFYSLAEGMPIEQQYHLSRLSSSIRETWDLLDDSKTTDLIRTQYPVSAKAALKLAYLMFYQRFLDSMSDLRVHVSDRLLAGIGQEIMAGHFPITVFDDVYQDVLMLLYVDVYLKLRNAA